MQCSESNAADK